MGTNAKSMESMDDDFDVAANVLVTGAGCLGMLREYRSRRDGKKLLFVDINVNGTRYSCIFSGNEDERAVLQMLELAVVMKKHVTLGFALGDLHPEAFIYTSGSRAGQPGVSLKARLLSVSWAKVDGKEIYRAVAGGTGEHLDVDVTREAAGRPENVKRSEWPNWTAVLSMLENRRLREMEKACRALGLGSQA